VGEKRRVSFRQKGEVSFRESDARKGFKGKQRRGLSKRAGGKGSNRLQGGDEEGSQRIRGGTKREDVADKGRRRRGGEI